MRNLGNGRETDSRDSDESAILRYEELCRSGRSSLERFWAELGPGRPITLLSSLVKVELQHRFSIGESPRAAEYLGRFPKLAEVADRVVSVVYEEFCLLEEAGARPDPSEFVEIYGEWRDSLLSQLVYHRELSQVAGMATPNIKFPVEGDRFASYRLRSVLGTGGAAKVYLATDDDLGGRRVALKISASVGREPSILANLDHRNIVPILGVTQSDEAGLRGFCMPYRPGVTLEELIRRIGRGEVPRKAKAIWDLLVPVEDDEAPSLTKLDREGWAGFPGRGSFSEAVAWIGLALSNALAYLHERGVRHRDIKPANVLLAYREGPQLLDFNLAHDRIAAEQAQDALRGGTLPYMAPEQLRAFLDPSAWSKVDSPADIYALGLVLRELVSGMAPELPNRHLTLPRAIEALHDRRASPGVPLRTINPGVPPALESIIAKCVAFEPSDRYETADELAEDLRRFLDRRPLKVAANTSVVERGANWFSRNRNRVAGATLCLAMVFGGLGSKRDPSIERDPEFQAAVVDFDAGTPELRERAKQKFERLHQAYRTSAWPSLYLGLIWEDRHLTRKAVEIMTDACACGDAEVAIGQLRKKMPQQTTLHNMMGLCLLNQNRLDEARAALLRSKEIDPGRSGTLALLSRVEMGAGKLGPSIEYLEQALRSGESADIEPAMVRNRREVLLFLQTKHVDEQLIVAKDQATWKAIASQLGSMDAQIRELDADPDKGKLRLFISSYYTGVIASARGVVASHESDLNLARTEFERASGSFAKALKFDLDAGDRTKYRGELNRHLALNQKRASQWGGVAGTPKPTVVSSGPGL